MADYKIMYENLFNAVTDAIDILQKAQTYAEETYINQGEPKITMTAHHDDDKKE